MNKFEAKDIEIGGKVYAVTKDGGIFMHSYTDRAGKIRKNKWLKKIDRKGRESVNITDLSGNKIVYYVHQVVMMAWGTPAPEGMENPTIDHIDNDKDNNHIDNLQWLSHSDNVKKMWDSKTEDEMETYRERMKRYNAEGKVGWSLYNKTKAEAGV